MDEEGDAGFDSRSGRARGARVAVDSRLEMAGEVVVKKGRYQRDHGVEAQDEHRSIGSTSSRKAGHGASIDMPGV